MGEADQLPIRRAAIEALSADQVKKLYGFAVTMALGTGESSDDFVQGAMLRWLKSKVPLTGAPDEAFEFLRKAIKSIRSNAFRRQRTVRDTHGVRALALSEDDEDPMEQAADPTPPAEDQKFAQQLYDLCAADPEVQMLLTYQVEGARRAEIEAELGWNHNKYEAVCKRRDRMIVRWKREGILI